MTSYRVSFPQMGHYAVGFREIARLIDGEILMPPPITQRTLELGCQHSPESVCIPFKFMLGGFLEALDGGANLLIQAGGGCRFGFYAEVQCAILRDLGYEFDLLNLHDYRPPALLRTFRVFNPSMTYGRLARGFALALSKAAAIEEFEAVIRKSIGFEVRPGDFEHRLDACLRELDGAETLADVKRIRRRYREIFQRVPIDKPERPLRVALVGELYVVMEPFSNFQIEKTLGRLGVEVHRSTTICGIVRDFFGGMRHVKQNLRDAHPYLHRHVGAHGTESVGIAHRKAREGFDGVIHLKPFGCMPEINAIPALHRISRDYGFPIIYFSFDAQTSETGVQTRLEAFCDMLSMRRSKNHEHGERLPGR